MIRNSFLFATLLSAALAPRFGLAAPSTTNPSTSPLIRLAQTSPATTPTIAMGEPNPAALIALPALFSDGMVLQRGIPVPFWGTAAPGQKVTVQLGKQAVSATADGEGKWMLRLAALEAGGPFEVTVSGSNTITYKDVLVGDVWVASGQSNMAMKVASSNNAQAEKAASSDPQLRMFTVAGNAKFDTPQTELAGKWKAAAPDTTGNFSAVAYFFARDLRKELGIPIGILHSSWGGTVAQAWTSRQALEAVPSLKPLVNSYLKTLEQEQKAKDKYDSDMAAWKAEADKAKAEGLAEPANKPVAPKSSIGNPNRPATLYNGMIAPLIPYGIKGAIWYQGESNAGEPALYRKLFPTMIANWRADWKQGDFPFLFVQLAAWLTVQKEPSEGGWSGIREAQAAALKVPGTGMAVATDIGDAKDIHPKNKQDVGHRLALAALAQVYGRKIEYSGPVYETMTVEGSAIRLRFTHTEGGLKIKDGEDLKGFGIAGADKKFVWAQAKIDGDSIIVSSPDVAVPAAVRYNWASNPIGNLFNGAGLPAPPFRTDTW